METYGVDCEEDGAGEAGFEVAVTFGLEPDFESVGVVVEAF